jgi:hypothetical protein
MLATGKKEKCVAKESTGNNIAKATGLVLLSKEPCKLRFV